MKKYLLITMILLFTLISKAQILNLTGDRELDTLISCKLIDKLFIDEANFSNENFLIEAPDGEASSKFSVSVSSSPIVRKNYSRAVKNNFQNKSISLQDIKKSFEVNLISIKKLNFNKYNIEIQGYVNRTMFEFAVSPFIVQNESKDSYFGISIVIPTFNCLNECLTCVHMLKSSIKAPEDLWEVIVVADGCTDGTGAYFSTFFKSHSGFENFRVIWTDKEPGVYRNAGWPENSGVRAAKFSHIALCDCDVYHLCDPVSPSLKVLNQKPNVVIVGDLYCVSSPNSTCFSDSEDCKLEKFRWNENSEPGWLVLSKSIYIDIGGSSEELVEWGYEDEDLIRRLEKLNLEKVRLSEIICAWRHEKTDAHKLNWREKWNKNKNIVQSHSSVKRNENKPNWGAYYLHPVQSEGTPKFSKGL